jgi:hypothetical protein
VQIERVVEEDPVMFVRTWAYSLTLVGQTVEEVEREGDGKDY